MGDEQLRDLLRSLPDNPATYDRVVDAVFNMSRGSEAAEDEVAGAPAPVQVGTLSSPLGAVLPLSKN